MIKQLFKFISFGIIFFFLFTFETSFLSFLPFSFPLAILIAIIFNLLEKPEKSNGFYVSFWAGFFTDLFFSSIFGLTTISLLIFSFLIKSVLHHYVHFPQIA